MTYHPRNGRGYGHVIVFKFYRLPWNFAVMQRVARVRQRQLIFV